MSLCLVLAERSSDGNHVSAVDLLLAVSTPSWRISLKWALDRKTQAGYESVDVSVVDAASCVRWSERSPGVARRATRCPYLMRPPTPPRPPLHVERNSVDVAVYELVVLALDAILPRSSASSTIRSRAARPSGSPRRGRSRVG